MAKKQPWLCSCAITMREIKARINFGRELEGKRPLNWQRFYQMRREAAQAFLDEHWGKKHGNTGLDRNPYLPDRMIGNNYIFKPEKANRLIRLGVALDIAENMGRKPGSRVLGGRVLQPA
jgi:hypothetical protein